MNVLVDEATLRSRVAELAASITSKHAGQQLDVICLLNGASLFCADLVRLIGCPTRVHHLGFDSYAGAPPSGEVRITLDVAEPLFGKHVLVVEGVVISGRTPKYLMDLLKLRQPATLELCALGIKPKARAVDLDVAFFGFEFGPQIAVGYGMGKGSERVLPYIVEGSAH
jgi:hypoxanthine phosphoribosyltransferase